jgi:RNA polymerase sigma-70 factor (ECF subfamily)
MMPAVPEPDPLRSLMDAAREGDDRALAELVRRTQAPVWRLCAALGSPTDSADLVQETYLRAIPALAHYRGDAPVVPWLLSIARRVCADHVRRQQRQRRLIDRLESFAVRDSAGGPGDADVRELLASLAPDRREAFVLTQELGLSYEEAALVVGCPVGTIRSRVSRARSDLLQAVRQADIA